MYYCICNHNQKILKLYDSKMQLIYVLHLVFPLHSRCNEILVSAHELTSHTFYHLVSFYAMNI